MPLKYCQSNQGTTRSHTKTALKPKQVTTKDLCNTVLVQDKRSKKVNTPNLSKRRMSKSWAGVVGYTYNPSTWEGALEKSGIQITFYSNNESEARLDYI